VLQATGELDRDPGDPLEVPGAAPLGRSLESLQERE
jgi:hypothetical protein